MSRHTPGPWWVAEHLEVIGPEPDNDSVCMVLTDANARLISAAPDLLDALEHVSRLDPSDCYRIGFAAVFEEMQDRARAAIAKATASATREKA